MNAFEDYDPDTAPVIPPGTNPLEYDIVVQMEKSGFTPYDKVAMSLFTDRTRLQEAAGVFSTYIYNHPLEIQFSGRTLNQLDRKIQKTILNRVQQFADTINVDEFNEWFRLHITDPSTRQVAWTRAIIYFRGQGLDWDWDQARVAHNRVQYPDDPSVQTVYEPYEVLKTGLKIGIIEAYLDSTLPKPILH